MVMQQTGAMIVEDKRGKENATNRFEQTGKIAKQSARFSQVGFQRVVVAR